MKEKDYAPSRPLDMAMWSLLARGGRRAAEGQKGQELLPHLSKLAGRLALWNCAMWRSFSCRLRQSHAVCRILAPKIGFGAFVYWLASVAFLRNEWAMSAWSQMGPSQLREMSVRLHGGLPSSRIGPCPVAGGPLRAIAQRVRIQSLAIRCRLGSQKKHA